MSKKTLLILFSLLILCACFVVITAAVVFLVVRNNNLNQQLQESNQQQNNNQTDTEDVDDQDVNPEQEQTFEVDTFLEEDSTSEFEFKAEIPVGLSNNEELELAFNTYVSEALLDTAAEFSAELPPTPGAGMPTFESSYELIYQDEKFVSIRVLETSYLGGAHPSSVVKVINYDLTKNEPIELTDMFNNSASFRNSLSRISREILVSEYGTDFESQINTGTQPNLNNFAEFNFTDERFSIAFQEYQVGPYALGVPYVEFDWSEISEYLKEGYSF